MSDFTIGDLCAVIAKTSGKKKKIKDEKQKRTCSASSSISEETKNKNKMHRKRSLSEGGENTKKKKMKKNDESNAIHSQEDSTPSVNGKDTKTEKKNKNGSKNEMFTPPDSNKSLHKKKNKTIHNEDRPSQSTVKSSKSTNKLSTEAKRDDNSIKSFEKKSNKKTIENKENENSAEKSSEINVNNESLKKKKKKKKKKKSIINEGKENLDQNLSASSLDKKESSNSTEIQVESNKKKKKKKKSKSIVNGEDLNKSNNSTQNDKINDSHTSPKSTPKKAKKKKNSKNEMDLKIDKDALESTFTAPIDPKHLGIKNEKPDTKRKSRKMIMIEKRLNKSNPTKHPDDEKRTIFVGNVDCKLKRKVIERHFKTYGKIESVRLRGIATAELTMSKKEAITTGKFHPKRETVIAFVRFEEEESVEKALIANGSLLGERHIRVDKSVNETNYDKNSVFIGNVCFEAENEEVYKFFEECGKITNVRLVRSNETGASKGFGFVSFEKRDAVELALQLDGKQLYGKALRIKRVAKKEKPMKKSRSGEFKHERLLKKKKNNSFMKKDKPKQNWKGPENSFAGDQVSKSGTADKKKNSKTEKIHSKNAEILAGAGGQNKRILFND